MSDERTSEPTAPERRLLTRTSICQISAEGTEVTLQIGKLSLRLTPVELAALGGSCRTAVRQLFPRRARLPVPYLRLVPHPDQSG